MEIEKGRAALVLGYILESLRVIKNSTHLFGLSSSEAWWKFEEKWK